MATGTISNMNSQSVNDYLYYSDNLVFLHFCGYEISSQNETIYSLPAQYAPKKRVCAPVVVVGSTGNHYLGYVIIDANSTSVKSNALTTYGTSSLTPVAIGNKLYGQIMWQC